MSKQVKRKKKKAPSSYDYDRHHCLYTRRTWNVGYYSNALRSSFIYAIRVSDHRRIHANVYEIPLPSEDVLKVTWERYCRDKDCIKLLTYPAAVEWLINNIDDDDCVAALEAQLRAYKGR